MQEVCELCGRTADPSTDGDPSLTWSSELVQTTDASYTRWVCADCTRRNLRSIEAKLDREWW